MTLTLDSMNMLGIVVINEIDYYFFCVLNFEHFIFVIYLKERKKKELIQK